jgi:hypothetical protein
LQIKRRRQLAQQIALAEVAEGVVDPGEGVHGGIVERGKWVMKARSVKMNGFSRRG